MQKRHSHDAETAQRQLPVRLPPVPDELLSSWISRHAAFYAVPPLVMLRHCLPEVHSLRTADLHLSEDQEIRLAKVFFTAPADIRRMTFANVPSWFHRFIAARPVQRCTNCGPIQAATLPVLRDQLMGWRITCLRCENLLQGWDGHAVPSPFRQYHSAAIRGEKLLHDEIEFDVRRGPSPTEIARLLLMRRIVFPAPPEQELYLFRVLGVIIPDLDRVLAATRTDLPTPARPILPLHLRAAVLAGVAIVESAGPEMLRLLRCHTMGDNMTRFSDAAETLIAQAGKHRHASQRQLI
jgi:hypothetical protein